MRIFLSSSGNSSRNEVKSAQYRISISANQKREVQSDIEKFPFQTNISKVPVLPFLDENPTFIRPCQAPKELKRERC